MKLSKCNFAKEIQYLGHVVSSTGIKQLPSRTAAIKLMKALKMLKNSKSIPWPCWLLLQFHQEFCLSSKIPLSPYPSWCKICLDIRSPCSIQYPQKHFDRSTYPPLSTSFQMIHSIHRSLRWCLWSSVVRNSMAKNWQLHLSPTHSQTPNENGALLKRKPML